jgi:hypothetical protein
MGIGRRQDEGWCVKIRPETDFEVKDGKVKGAKVEQARD